MFSTKLVNLDLFSVQKPASELSTLEGDSETVECEIVAVAPDKCHPLVIAVR